MSFEARAINKIGLAAQPVRLPSPAERLNLARRTNLVDRLISSIGNRLATILSHDIFSTFDPRAGYSRNMSNIIREVLTFDKHEATGRLIEQVLTEVEQLPQDRLMTEAQWIIDRYYQDKTSNNEALKDRHPTCPTVREFAALTANGEFDPYQFFLSSSWNNLNTILDYGRLRGYDKIVNRFNPEDLRCALVLTYAFAALPA